MKSSNAFGSRSPRTTVPFTVYEGSAMSPALLRFSSAASVAQRVGITERAVQRIVAELVDAGFLERCGVGRRNEYRFNRERSMRHPAQHGQDGGALLDLLELKPPEASE